MPAANTSNNPCGAQTCVISTMQCSDTTFRLIGLNAAKLSYACGLLIDSITKWAPSLIVFLRRNGLSFMQAHVSSRTNNLSLGNISRICYSHYASHHLVQSIQHLHYQHRVWQRARRQFLSHHNPCSTTRTVASIPHPRPRASPTPGTLARQRS